MGFSFERDLQKAVQTINDLILQVNKHGGGICLVDLDNPAFSVKLDRPVEITYFIPICGRKRGNDGIFGVYQVENEAICTEAQTL